MAPATSLLREAQNWKPRWRKLQCSAQSHPKSAFSFLHLVLDVASCHLNGRWCQDFTYTLDNYMYEYMINTYIYYILYTFPRFEVYSHDYQWYFVKWVKRPGHLVPGGSSLGAGWFGVDPAGLAGNHHLVGILWLDLLHFWGSRVFFWSKPRRGEILGHLGWNLLRLTGDDPMIRQERQENSMAPSPRHALPVRLRLVQWQGDRGLGVDHLFFHGSSGWFTLW